MPRHLILRLEAPLVAFGGEAIDNYGVTRDFPAASMLTGLLANALGWRRTDRAAHQRLQDRLVFAARRDREPRLGRLREYQNARLYKNDMAWTTRGVPEGRAGGSYNLVERDGRKYLTHQRYRDHHADALVLVAMRLRPADEDPTLEDLATALDRPARPLFIGRKPCLPSARLFGGFVEAATARAVLGSLPAQTDAPLRAIWPAEEGEEGADRIYDLTDERNWLSGLHGGARRVCEGRIRAASREDRP